MRMLRVVRGECRKIGPEQSWERLIDAVSSRLDAELRDAASGGPRVDCRPGCSYCCNRVIFCQIPEVLRAADFIRGSWTPQEVESLRERLHQYERAVAPSFGRKLGLLRPVCPALVNGACSIYPARPVLCRSCFATDAADCRERKESGGAVWPFLGERVQIGRSVHQGVRECLDERGLNAGLYDFGRALRIALENTEAAERWNAGEDDFAAALIRPPDNDAAPPVTRVDHPRYGPDDEPIGKIDVAGLLLSQYLASTEADLRAGLEAAKGEHPAYALWKIRVPYTYASEDEVLDWRAYFERTLDEFSESSFDPKQAFDALGIYSSYLLTYQQFNNRELLEKLGEVLCYKISSKAVPDLAVRIEGPRKPGKVRVGYISENLRYSSCSPWGLGWAQNHSSDFETYGFFLGEAPDRVTAQFKAALDHFLHLAPTGSVTAQARLIKSLDLDVLIYLDVNVNPRTTPFTTLRLARVQCAAWGGPQTTGLPTIDYYLSSELMEASNADEHYSERLIRLPGIGICFVPDRIVASTLERADFGAAGAPLFVVLQEAPKLGPQWDHLYLRINEATGATITMIDRPRVGGKVAWRRLAQKGVRFRLLPQLNLHDYWALLGLADAIIDPPGCSGGITGIHALRAKAPLVTMPRELKRSRHGMALLRACGGENLIAKDIDEFVNLVADEERRLAARQCLRPDDMMNDLRSVRALEDHIRSWVAA